MLNLIRNWTGSLQGILVHGLKPVSLVAILTVTATLSLGASRALAQPGGPSGEPQAGPMDDLRLQAISNKKRFAARGHLYAHNVRIATWAEEIASRVEAELQAPFRTDAERPVWFVINFNQGQPPEAVRSAQLFDQTLVQRIIINRPDEINQEDLLETLVTTILNRYLNAGAVKKGKKELHEVPEWFSVGMAQYIMPELRDRNREVVYQDWITHREPRPRELMSIRVFPPGRLPEKATCCALYGWFRQQAGFHRTASKMFSRWGQGERVDMDWLVDSMIKMESDRDIEQSWDLFMAFEGGERKLWDRSMEEQITMLKSYMRFTPSEFGVTAPKPYSDELTLAELVSIPRDQWFQDTVLNLDLKVKMLGLGQPLAMQNVINQYGNFLDKLYEAIPGESTGYVPSMEEQRELEQLLGMANRSLVQLEQTLHVSDTYQQFSSEIRKVFPSANAPADTPYTSVNRSGQAPRTVRLKPAATGLQPVRPVFQDRLDDPERYREPDFDRQAQPSSSAEDDRIQEFYRRLEEKNRNASPRNQRLPLP